MQRLLFVGRVAVICNLFFFLCLLIRHTHVVVPQPFVGLAIITGWIMSVCLNIIFAFFVTVYIRKNRKELATWLVAFNLFWLVFQILYFLFDKQ